MPPLGSTAGSRVSFTMKQLFHQQRFARAILQKWQGVSTSSTIHFCGKWKFLSLDRCFHMSGSHFLCLERMIQGYLAGVGPIGLRVYNWAWIASGVLGYNSERHWVEVTLWNNHLSMYSVILFLMIKLIHPNGYNLWMFCRWQPHQDPGQFWEDTKAQWNKTYISCIHCMLKCKTMLSKNAPKPKHQTTTCCVLDGYLENHFLGLCWVWCLLMWSISW